MDLFFRGRECEITDEDVMFLVFLLVWVLVCFFFGVLDGLDLQMDVIVLYSFELSRFGLCSIFCSFIGNCLEE